LPPVPMLATRSRLLAPAALAHDEAESESPAPATTEVCRK
jgi:hypothetical protein